MRLNGAPPGDDHGLDVDASGSGVVAAPRMYQLVRLRAPIRRHDLRDHLPRSRCPRLRLHLWLTSSSNGCGTMGRPRRVHPARQFNHSARAARSLTGSRPSRSAAGGAAGSGRPRSSMPRCRPRCVRPGGTAGRSTWPDRCSSIAVRRTPDPMGSIQVARPTDRWGCAGSHRGRPR